MSDPRFKPRDYADLPHEFGRSETIEWRTVADPERHRLKASVLQHYFALAVRDALERESGASVESLALVAQTSHDRMARVLRGDVIMRLEDVAAAGLTFTTFYDHVDAYLPLMLAPEDELERNR